jgi:hypothetical protein
VQSGRQDWFLKMAPPGHGSCSAAVAYSLLVLGLFAWERVFDFQASPLAYGAVRFVNVLVFAISNALFIQWCKLTRLRAPLVKRILYLGLYYTAAGIIAFVLGTQSEAAGESAVNPFTPAGIFNDGVSRFLFPGTLFAGIALQLVAILVLLAMINGRLKRPAMVRDGCGLVHVAARLALD